MIGISQCAGPIAEGAALTFTCPQSNQVVSAVQFASYGTSSGFTFIINV